MQPRRRTRQVHVGLGRGRRRRADLGAVDDHHQDRRRRRHPRPDLRPRRRGVRHRALHLQRGRGRRGPRPDRAPLAGADHRRHPLPVPPRRWRRMEAGVQALRLNPGNIRKPEHIKAVAREAKERGLPIRIGVNAGSARPRHRGRARRRHPRGAGRQRGARARLLPRGRLRRRQDLGQGVERAGHDRRLPAPLRDRRPSRCTSASPRPARRPPGSSSPPPGIATLLAEGIGDTIRYSLTADPVEEAQGRPDRCSRRSACASARASTSSPARRAGAPRST